MDTMEIKQAEDFRRAGLTGYRSADLGEEDKEKIIKDFLPFIKYTAHRLLWRLPPQLTVDDLISAGLMGLLDALERFEHGRVKLKTFAEIRIRGAMFDELRAGDWVPRSVKKKLSELKHAHVKLQNELGRPPEAEEVVEELGMSLEEYYNTLKDARGSVSFRIEDFTDSSGDGLDLLECIPDPEAKDPLSVLEETDRKEFLAGLIGNLPEKEKLVLSLYYWEELTMKEIGAVLDLTESRVCQLHGQALLRLKGRVENTN